MGTIKSGILGGFSGKVGGVVGTSWKGLAVMKAMPQSVANPRTNAQVEQRNKMSQIVNVAGLLLANYIKPLWDRFAQQMSGYNAFVQANIAAFNADGLFEPSAFILSRGKMAATPFTVAEIAANVGLVEASFDPGITDSYQQDTDLCYLVAYAETSKKWSVPAMNKLRSYQYASISFQGSLLVGETVHCWIAFRRADGTVASETSYTTKVVTA